MMAYGLFCFWLIMMSLSAIFGIVYPLFMVIVNKVFFKSKLSVKEILKRI